MVDAVDVRDKSTFQHMSGVAIRTVGIVAVCDFESPSRTAALVRCSPEEAHIQALVTVSVIVTTEIGPCFVY